MRFTEEKYFDDGTSDYVVFRSSDLVGWRDLLS